MYDGELWGVKLKLEGRDAFLFSVFPFPTYPREKKLCTSGIGGCDLVEDPRPWVCGVQTQLKEGVPSSPQAVSAIPFKPELVLDKNSTEIRKVSSICEEITEQL